MVNYNPFFVSDKQVKEIAKNNQTPVYVYSKEVLTKYAKEAKLFKTAYGTAVRYAVKANPNKEVVQLFDSLGLLFDASSAEEAELLLSFGIKPQKIALNSQQLPNNLQQLVKNGVFFTATSLHQLEQYCKIAPNSNVGVRLNPGVGSGTNNRVTTGGVAASFGIWHEYIPKIIATAKKANVTITKVHTHIGAGTDPTVWQQSAKITLGLCKKVLSATVVSFGGGFKVGRMPNEQTADIALIGTKINKLVQDFAKDTGREMFVEIEPGTYLTAMAGVLIAKVIDVTNTGKDGYNFIRTNTGMNDFLRTSMYGAQHPLKIVNIKPTAETKKYVVVGHNCESGDILTSAKGNPDQIEPRQLNKATIGDYLVLAGAGAYCASMRAIGYNAFAPAKEIIID